MREKAAFGRLTLGTATGVTVCLCMHVEKNETVLRSERVQLRQAVMIRTWRDVVTCMTLGIQAKNNISAYIWSRVFEYEQHESLLCPKNEMMSDV